MKTKRILTNEILELYCVIEHFRKKNMVVIERWTIRYGFTFEMIVSEINLKIDVYNRRYGKRFGHFKKIQSSYTFDESISCKILKNRRVIK